jgi:hypothetical protein
MANSSTMVYSKNNQLQNSVRGVLHLWLILELIVYQIGEMVEGWQGNGKLLHDGENGLIAIYFFAIEQRCGNGELLKILNFFAIEPWQAQLFIGYSPCLSCTLISQMLEEEVPTELKVLLTLTGTLTSFRSTPL